jgi:hypothetical protein
VPTGWLRACLAFYGANDLRLVIEAINNAAVSGYVACIRLRDLLPSGYVFAVLAGGKVALAGQTAGTGVEVPRIGEHLERTMLDTWASAVYKVEYGPTTVIWWAFRGGGRPTFLTRDPRRTLKQVLTHG